MSLIFGSDKTDKTDNIVIFDVSKNTRKLNDEFKVLQRKLKAKWKFVELVKIKLKRYLIV